MEVIIMTIKKFAASLVLSASIITFGAADCVMNTPQVASACSLENRLVENLTSIEDGRNINEIIDIRQCKHNHGMNNYYGYQNATYVYVR